MWPPSHVSVKTHIETLLYTTTISITIIIWYNDVIILIYDLLLVHQFYLVSQILLQEKMKCPPCYNSPDYIACDRLPPHLQNWHNRTVHYSIITWNRQGTWMIEWCCILFFLFFLFFCHGHFTVQVLADIVQLRKVANLLGSEHHVAMNVDFVIELIAGHCIQLRLLLSFSPRVDLNFHCWQLIK